MKKIILPIIFISCSVIYSNILFVPEEFLTIQQAVVVAQNEDTVSVNFGHPNGQRITVTTSRIFGKDITFEVRGEGKEKLFEMLKVTNNQPNTNSNPLDSGWTEQGLVNRIDSSSDQQPHIAVNNSGQPWVIWMGWVGSSDLAYSKWNGENWDEEMGVINYNGAFRFRPRISFDDQNRAWVVYDRKSLLADTDAIYFTRWNGSGWEPELPVHQADSIRLNFAPKIAFGGGQIWCCWYGNVTDRRYKIYVSRWNGNNWEPKTQISPPDTSHRWHWWCDIAVDSLGLPHVVWSVTGLWEQYVFYRTYDGTQWLAPETLNNPQMVRPGDWGGTAISIDNQGTIHVSWGGVVTGGNYEDVFYSKKENGRWLDPVRINMPDNYADFPQCIISKEPENIWIGWGKQAPISESYAYVSHFDGLSWSPEERLGDMGISYWNGIPELVFISDEVWAVWHGYTVGIDYMDIYYSRYLSSSVSEEQSMELSITNVLAYPNPFGYSISFSYKKTSPGLTSLMIYNLNGSLIRVLTNRYLEGGYSKITWDGKDMKGKETPKGVYFAILKIVESKTVKKIIKWRTK